MRRDATEGGAQVDEAFQPRARNAWVRPRKYRSHVGPADQYDFMGATQFRLLCALGLREHHRVLDFGCGSLRAGRLLIPYLQPSRYFGIEPNRRILHLGIDNELGNDLVAIKRPTFSYSDEFTAEIFEERFDFIVAQSIFSHAGRDLIARALSSFSRRLEAGGICAVTFAEGSAKEVMTGWRYPACVQYPRSLIREMIAAAGLVGMAIRWFHPRQTWFLLAQNPEALPSRNEARLLEGAVLRCKDLRASIPNRGKKHKSRPKRREFLTAADVPENTD